MDPLTGALIGGGMSLLGGFMGSGAAKDAAQIQAAAADRATQAQMAMYGQGEANVAPWLQAGKTSLSDLMAGMKSGSFDPLTSLTPEQLAQDPAYQFRLQQGLGALTNQASLTGGMNTRNMQGMVDYSQGLASTSYRDILNAINQARQTKFSNLAGLSQEGLGAGLQQAGLGARLGADIGSNIMSGAGAQAAGRIGSTNALMGGLGGAYNQWLQSQFMNQPQVTTPNYGGDQLTAV